MDERSEELARAHAALAAAQDRSYWLDRWHLDLNALMRRRGASELRAAMRAARAVYRTVYNAVDRLRRSSRALPGRAAAARRVLGDEHRQAGRMAEAAPGGRLPQRLTAGAVSDRLGERIDGDDPGALVAVQRADILVHALSRTGAEPAAGQKWMGLGESADAVLQLLEDAFPGLRRTLDGGGIGAVDVAFALSDWRSGTAALEQVDELRHAVRPGGRLVLTAPARSEGQTVTPQGVLAHCTPDWRIALYVPGGMEGGRDLYVLERA
jgi:hypothetical protein